MVHIIGALIGAKIGIANSTLYAAGGRREGVMARIISLAGGGRSQSDNNGSTDIIKKWIMPADLKKKS